MSICENSILRKIKHTIDKVYAIILILIYLICGDWYLPKWQRVLWIYRKDSNKENPPLVVVRVSGLTVNLSILSPRSTSSPISTHINIPAGDGDKWLSWRQFKCFVGSKKVDGLRFPRRDNRVPFIPIGFIKVVRRSTLLRSSPLQQLTVNGFIFIYSGQLEITNVTQRAFCVFNLYLNASEMVVIDHHDHHHYYSLRHPLLVHHDKVLLRSS